MKRAQTICLYTRISVYMCTFVKRFSSIYTFTFLLNVVYPILLLFAIKSKCLARQSHAPPQPCSTFSLELEMKSTAAALAFPCLRYPRIFYHVIPSPSSK